MSEELLERVEELEDHVQFLERVREAIEARLKGVQAIGIRLTGRLSRARARIAALEEERDALRAETPHRCAPCSTLYVDTHPAVFCAICGTPLWRMPNGEAWPTYAALRADNARLRSRNEQLEALFRLHLRFEDALRASEEAR